MNVEPCSCAVKVKVTIKEEKGKGKSGSESFLFYAVFWPAYQAGCPAHFWGVKTTRAVNRAQRT